MCFPIVAYAIGRDFSIFFLFGVFLFFGGSTTRRTWPQKKIVGGRSGGVVRSGDTFLSEFGKRHLRPIGLATNLHLSQFCKKKLVFAFSLTKIISNEK